MVKFEMSLVSTSQYEFLEIASLQRKTTFIFGSVNYCIRSHITARRLTERILRTSSTQCICLTTFESSKSFAKFVSSYCSIFFQKFDTPFLLAKKVAHIFRKHIRTV